MRRKALLPIRTRVRMLDDTHKFTSDVYRTGDTDIAISNGRLTWSVPATDARVFHGGAWVSIASLARTQNRDESGRYDLDGRMDRVCRCGHRLGDHCASSPHECFIPTMKPYTPCDCKRFGERKPTA